MVMRGIDVSNWQASLDLGQAFKAGCEFVVVKISQGTSYLSPARNKQLTQIATAKKLLGFYHFANGENPEAEARFFEKHARSLLGSGIPVLDFEVQIDEDKYRSPANWCARFVNEFHKLTGVYPAIYLNSGQLRQFKGSWIVDKCPLWLARYTANYRTWTDNDCPPCAPWSRAIIWQFTSSLRIAGYDDNLDGDLCYLTPTEWKQLAKGGKTSTAKPKATKKPTAQIVSKIVSGKYGTGLKRREALAKDGYDYAECQKLVNVYYKVANDVIKGKYGNGATRKQKLEKAGYNAAVVQQIVNMLVR